VAGVTGPTGAQGDSGSGVTIVGTTSSTAPSDPETGQMWIVGTPVPGWVPASMSGPALTGDGVVWTGTGWSNVGPIRGAPGPAGVAGLAGPAGPTGPVGEIAPIAPPASSPSFTVGVLFKTLTVQTDSIEVYTTLRYQVALDAAFTQISLTVEDRQTYVQLSPLPAGVDLWVRVTAFNDVGSAAPSPASGPYQTVLIANNDVSNTTLTMQKFRNSLHLIY
jgi:hypothetical protein